MPIKTLTLSDFKNIALKNYSDRKFEPITETSPYIELVYGTKRIVVKKTSLCWLLQEDLVKMSNDRLMRVRAEIHSNKVNSKAKSKRARMCTVKPKKKFKMTLRRSCKY